MMLSLTTCQAINTVGVSRAISRYLAAHLALPVQFVNDISWRERYRLIGRGKIDVSWICGLPYVRMVETGSPTVRLLAAPVMSATRYEGLPIYFSDVVVHRHSPFRSFADLRGATWAYNEPGSQSGYNVACQHLASLGENVGFFGRQVQSGAHRTSIGMVIRGLVDAAAIDSTVLEWEFAHRPQLRHQLRVVETLGPSPIPPWVVVSHLPGSLRRRLQTLLLSMHDDREGRLILKDGGLDRFVAVEDMAYDRIRVMADQARDVRPAGST